MQRLLKSKKMRKKKLYLLVSITIISLCNAQGGSNGAAGSADSNINESNIATYGEKFDVDLYSGNVNINIPVQKIQEGDLSLDIGLNYDATGVLVNNISGIVGQNWYLNAGGSITRKIKGMWFDELSHKSVYVPEANTTTAPLPLGGAFEPYERGFFHVKKLLTPNYWSTPEYLRHMVSRMSYSTYNNNPTYDILSYAEIGSAFKWDTEPDIFYFSFFGKSGYFFMGEDGKWKVSSKNNLKVVDYNENTDLINPVEGITKHSAGTPVPMSRDYKRKSIGKLTLIDDKGFQYIFGDNDVKSMEINLGGYYDSKYAWPYVMKWNLKKVIDPNGILLFNFDYKTGEYFLENLSCDSRFDISSSVEAQYNSTGFTVADSQVYTQWFRLYKASGYFYKPSYLKKITSNNGENITFEYQINDNIKYTNSNNPLFLPENTRYNNYFPSLYIYENGGLSTDEIPSSNTLIHNRYVLTEIKVNFLNKLVNTIAFQYANSFPRTFLNKIIKNNDEQYTFYYNEPFNLPGYLSEKTDMWGYSNGQPTSVSFSGRYAFWQNFENNKYSTRGTVTSKLLNGSLNKIMWPTGGATNFVFEPHSFRTRVTNQKSIINTALTEIFPNGGGGLRIKKIISEGKEREFFYNNTFDEMDNNISSGILLHEPVFFDRHNVYKPATHSLPEVTYDSGGTSSANGIKLKSDFFNSNVAYSTVFEKSNDGYTKYTFYDFNDSPDYYLPGLRPFNKISKKTDNSYDRGQLKYKAYYDSNQKIILEKSYQYKKLTILTSRGVEYDLFTSNWYSYGSAHPFNGAGIWPIPQPGCLMCNSKVSPYLINYTDKVLDKETTTEFFKDGRKIESLKMYYYQSPLDLSYSLIEKIEEYPNKYDLSKYKTTKFQYAVDMDTSDPLIERMVEKNMVGIPLSVTKYNEQQQPIARTETIFGKNSATNNLVLPVSTQNIKTGYHYTTDETIISKVTYDLYDAHGHLLQYTDESGLPTAIIYGYNRSQPIAKIVGATYNYVEANISLTTLQDASDSDVDDVSENYLITQLDDLRKNTAFKNFYITTYTYNPLIGITSLTNPDGIREYYKYDTQNKLEKVIDVDGKVIEEYKYNYKD